jgi:hypothetical protein
MAEKFTPRQAVKDLLQGIAPPRPLFLPIVFSLGARIENMPLRSFLANPTKITNSLRQIRTRLRSDGITCFCDPLLEAQALGGIVQWESDDSPTGVRWAPADSDEEFLAALPSAEVAVKTRCVTIGVEVIRRLKALTTDGSLLTACVTGPLKLARLLAHRNGSVQSDSSRISGEFLERATTAVSGVASAFAEAGTDVVFIREDFPPFALPVAPKNWGTALATAINIIRFYEALPVLLTTFPNSIAPIVDGDGFMLQARGGIMCFETDLSVGTDDVPKVSNSAAATTLGIALPLSVFISSASADADIDQNLRRLISERQPPVITTAGDIPATTDMKRLNRVWELLHC